MKNYETEAAWQYHNGTKHPSGNLLDRAHDYSPENRPFPYKTYPNTTEMRLFPDKKPTGISAIDAISTNIISTEGAVVPDISMLSRLLYFSGGITKTIKFPPPVGNVEFRAASCTGALYHIEIYVICSGIEGLDAGVYHYNPKNNALTVLQKGNFHRKLVDATAGDPFVLHAPITLIFTDVFARNAIKYQAREYRHAFWDCGTILANSLAITRAHKMSYKLVLGFVDSEINALLDIEPKKESSLAVLAIGYTTDHEVEPPPRSRVTPIDSDYDHDIFAITSMHESSILTDSLEVSSWRVAYKNKGITMKKRPVKNHANPVCQEALESVIIRRGSTRRFSHDAITAENLSTILRSSLGGYTADLDDNLILNDVYIIANSVAGLDQGAYYYNILEERLEILKKGDFRKISGHLGLDQDLPLDASATMFLMVDLQTILSCLGNRGYRIAQLDAGIIAGRIYLASYALKLGATGLTFYDDEITEFFSPHAKDKNTMLMVAVGKKYNAARVCR